MKEAGAAEKHGFIVHPDDWNRISRGVDPAVLGRALIRAFNDAFSDEPVDTSEEIEDFAERMIYGIIWDHNRRDHKKYKRSVRDYANKSGKRNAIRKTAAENAGENAEIAKTECGKRKDTDTNKETNKETNNNNKTNTNACVDKEASPQDAHAHITKEDVLSAAKAMGIPADYAAKFYARLSSQDWTYNSKAGSRKVEPGNLKATLGSFWSVSEESAKDNPSDFNQPGYTCRIKVA